MSYLPAVSAPQASTLPVQTPQKSFIATWLFALLLGGLGIDRFYLGKVGTGILKLLTFGGFGIWALVDLIITLTGNQKDKKGRPLAGYQEHKKVALWVSVGVIIASLVVGFFSPPAPALETLDEVDVNGLVVADACEAVRDAGWRVHEVAGSGDDSEKSDCSDTERKVVEASFTNVDDSWSDDRKGTVVFYFANDPKSPEVAPAKPAVPKATEEPTPVETTPPQAPAETAGGYQEIYDVYSTRLQNECPALSMTECAELSNEGVMKMAEYMYAASGTDGQYATYEKWAGDLMNVYMSSVQ